MEIVFSLVLGFYAVVGLVLLGCVAWCYAIRPVLVCVCGAVVALGRCWRGAE